MWGLLLAALAAFIGVPAATEGAAPDPLALLRGVEQARESISSGRIELNLKYSYPKLPKRGDSQIRLKCVFAGTNRRYDQYYRALVIDGSGPDGGLANNRRLSAMGEDREAFVRAGLGRWRDTHTRSAYDGTQFMQYSEEMGAYVMDPRKGTPDFVFDPKLLGISSQYIIFLTMTRILGYLDAKSVSLIGSEEVAGHRTWHVHVVDKYLRGRDFWIEDSANFRVYKSEYAGDHGKDRLVTTSEYGDPKGGPLPTRVLTREYDRTGTLSQETTITMDKGEFNKPVDAKAWTLAGLGLPLGKMVIDERIHRVVGHWDGEGLNPSFPAAMQKGRAARLKPLHWGMIVTGGIVLAVLAAAFVRRRDWLREGEA